MDWDKLLPIIIPSVSTIIGAAIGYFINYVLNKKAEFSSRNADKKREAYQDYVDFVIGFFEDSNLQRDQVETNKIVYGIYKRLILYGSPEVIETYGELFQLFYRNNNGKLDMKLAMGRMTAVFAEMRKDIGLSNKNLGVDGTRMLRPMLREFDDLMSGARTETIDMKSEEKDNNPNREQRRADKRKKK